MITKMQKIICDIHLAVLNSAFPLRSRRPRRAIFTRYVLQVKKNETPFYGKMGSYALHDA